MASSGSQIFGATVFLNFSKLVAQDAVEGRLYYLKAVGLIAHGTDWAHGHLTFILGFVPLSETADLRLPTLLDDVDRCALQRLAFQKDTAIDIAFPFRRPDPCPRSRGTPNFTPRI